LIGYKFVSDTAVSANNPGKVRYSGIEWRVELGADAGRDIAAGEQVEVTSVSAGLFRVKPVGI